MASSKYTPEYGKSDFADPTTVPAFWAASEHSALLQPSHNVKWEPALLPQDRRTNRALASVVLITVAVVASAAVLAMYS
jgi:hypothetical protein